ncbi:LLM class flavin-dependent oxidoreductase [Dyella sp.]|jgi:luciferase family oxidoreductase group 1|uniref:LLM class flavin-dependent oxidoreductase n=1 Tax=Dyella sp. TaxID=1869338 RepID=UPI002D76AC80|nr:LLM class flavin-dependent oxidoreductase [Dyella sp.]HET6431290.1 LLM class flavin-dependent oxidoreductase [Dyella sp.]
MIPFSILDLAPVTQGSDAAQAFRNALALARHGEALGYHRYWLAEHHNMPGIASAATAVLIGHVAGGTSTIRVGSGGIMLPNHAPLQVAEQFGTLASLYPGRIDLGLGRAPGTDQPTARALRRYFDSADAFPNDVVELLGYFEPAAPGQAVRAVPGAGLDVPVWLLGSSLFSARLAAQLGLPFAFASHFAPDAMDQALATYRRDFRPSARLAAPYAILALNVVAADSDAQARRLFTTQQQAFVNLRRGRPGLIPPPIDDIETFRTPTERLGVEQALACAVVGGPDTVQRGLAAFIARHRPDELLLTANIFDPAARLHSFGLAAAARSALASADTAVRH